MCIRDRIDPVWELYRLAHQLTGGASTLLEWDAKIPEFPVMHAEVLKSRSHMVAALPNFPAALFAAGQVAGSATAVSYTHLDPRAN